MKKKSQKKTQVEPVDTKKHAQPQPKSRFNYDRLTGYLNPASLIVTVLIACWYLPIENKNILYKIQDLSLFLPDKFFFARMMKVPGGLLSWGGNFLTQFFYYPWLGSIIFIALASTLQFLAMKAFRLPRTYFIFTSVISFACVLSITQLGYMIYVVKLQGYVFVPLLGLLVALLVLWGYRKITDWKYRTLASVLFVTFVYPLAGFYALLAGILFILHEIKNLISAKQKQGIIPIVAILLIAWLAPKLWCNIYFTQTDEVRIYTSGLPILFEPEKFAWLPYKAILILLGILWLLSFIPVQRKANFLTISGAMLVLLLGIYGLNKHSFSDRNFQTEVAMDLALFDNRWEDVLKLAKQQKDEPTRLIVMQTNLALQKLGRAGDEMFSYPNGCKEMQSPWPIRLVSHSGKSLYFHYGRINYSYHWCMEDMSERGPKVEDLRFMVKCALIKNELKLAQRYNDLLKKTLFHKAWAEKYQQYIDTPARMNQDSEFTGLKQLTNFENELFDDNGILELYLLNLFPQTKSTSTMMLDIAIQNALILRSSELFWPKFFEYVATEKHIPKHYQEAALMFAYFEQKVNVTNISFDSDMLEQFNNLINMCDKNVGNPREINQQIFKPAFGNSYWYYHFFGKKINTR